MSRLLGALAGLLAVAVLVGVAAFFWLQSYLDAPMSLQTPERVELKPGTSFWRFASQLESEGVLKHARILSLYVRYLGKAGSVKAGEYELVPGLTPKQLVALLVSGKVVEYQVTLVEGKTLKEWLAVLRETPELRLEAVDLSWEDLLKAVGASESHPEGLFYPDTYRYRKGDSDLALLRRAYQRMQEVLAEEWAQKAPGLPLKTPYEALILASIVEKETGVESERGEIAGVFTRRLQKKMRLQTDPTVIYGLGDEFQGNLRRRDLRRMTPYNTYRIAGLPPSPIAMPGRAAIHAALHPVEGKSLYFVARGDGSHYFSSTLEEHNKAVQKYQVRQRRSDYRSQPTSE